MNYQNYNDYELIYMVREHDDDSYGTLFEKYIPVIKHIAIDYYRQLQSYGYDLDDFIQEGYLGFQDAVLAFDERKDCLFYTFLVICINRKILSFCKRITSDSKNVSNTRFVNSDDVEILDSFPGMEELFLNREFLKCMWDIIYSFPIEYSAVYELKMNQFHYSEIAKLLDIKVKRVQFIVRTVSLKIRKELSFGA